MHGHNGPHTANSSLWKLTRTIISYACTLMMKWCS